MTPRDARAIRIGGGVVLVSFFLLRGVPTLWRRWHETRELLSSRNELLARSTGELAAMPALDSSAAQVRRRFIALAPRLVPGGTPAEAEAALSALVTSLADRSRVRLRQVEGVPDSAMGGALRGVGVTMEVEGDWAGAGRFLRALAADEVSLTLQRIQIQAVDPTSPPDRPEVLILRADLGGWYLPAGDR